MPLDTSRRLLLGGRYSQLPTLLEDDHQHQTPLYPRSAQLQQQSKLFNSRSDLSNIDSPDAGRKLNGHHGSSNGCRESRTNGAISVPSSPPLSSFPSPKISFREKTIKTGYAATRSSLVHTDGAVVPQVQPHHIRTSFTSELKPCPTQESLISTEVRLASHGRAIVRPSRPPRIHSPSNIRSTLSRPCMKQAKSSPPPVRPPRYRRPGTKGALLRAVTSRGGRAYLYHNLDDAHKDLESSEPGDEDSDSTEEATHGNPETSLSSDTQNTSIESSSSDIHSVGSSPRSSPPYTPPPRSPHPGILVSNATSRQGIKRLAR